MYRTHHCFELNESHEGNVVTLAGFLHRKRDHGGLLFIDLRDHYGITQCLFNPESPGFKVAEKLRNESIVQVSGTVVKREAHNVNLDLKTGHIEVVVDKIIVLHEGIDLPLPVNLDEDYNEEIRLKYRYLDLRRLKMHDNIIMRSKIIQALRHEMLAQNFLELQTPILTASSPEGARDYLVPSRHYPGKFYALPQAPQIFKQLYMASGFDRYFQIAPCFRDEDARADRSPGEFYQLDVEMAFATQDLVFETIEPVLYNVFKKFAGHSKVSEFPFVRIPYTEAIESYGSDKPDLRNPLRLHDVSSVFKDSDFTIFAKAIETGAKVIGIPFKTEEEFSRKFFDQLGEFGKTIGLAGVGYIIFNEKDAKGPIAKFLNEEQLQSLRHLVGEKGFVCFICEHPKKVYKLAGYIRTYLGDTLKLIDENIFEFCWIVDFPMFEEDEETGQIIFSHNPFSMPQGELKALETQSPLDIKAYQYDIVCNGIELCSGAIRNHKPEIMIKAFEIAGYSADVVENKFPALFHAFKFGAPPHGGLAPGIDRIVMLLTGEKTIREVIAFPLNQNAYDVMMNAPAEVDSKRLKELHLILAEDKKKVPLEIHS